MRSARNLGTRATDARNQTCSTFDIGDLNIGDFERSAIAKTIDRETDRRLGCAACAPGDAVTLVSRLCGRSRRCASRVQVGLSVGAFAVLESRRFGEELRGGDGCAGVDECNLEGVAEVADHCISVGVADECDPRGEEERDAVIHGAGIDQQRLGL